MITLNIKPTKYVAKNKVDLMKQIKTILRVQISMTYIMLAEMVFYIIKMVCTVYTTFIRLIRKLFNINM